jgi:hypothetical protein
MAHRYNPFKPGSVIHSGMFAGRHEEVQLIERCLLQTQQDSPEHFMILGERGIGKSSLLKYVDAVSKPFSRPTQRARPDHGPRERKAVQPQTTGASSFKCRQCRHENLPHLLWLTISDGGSYPRTNIATSFPLDGSDFATCMPTVPTTIPSSHRK